MKFWPSLFILISSIGCSSVRFYSSKKVPVSFDKLERYTRDVAFTVEKDFYLWGIVPGSQEIDLAQEARERGYGGLSEVKIIEKNNTSSWLLPVISFGFYIPRAYEVRAKVLVLK